MDHPGRSVKAVAYVLGLTGSFGSGKSTVASLLAEMGATVIDADKLAAEAVEPGQPALAALIGEFGPEIVDRQGRLQRKALAERIFGDRPAARRLEALIHPPVLAGIRRALEERRGEPLVVLDIPLLFEAGMEGWMDKIVVVTIAENQRFARLRRRGYSEREVMALLGMQMPQSRKITLADYVIDNSGTIEATRKHAQTLFEWIQGEKSKER
jgi:dephospho-CoA kinase